MKNLLLIAVLLFALASCGNSDDGGKDYNYGDGCSYMWMLMNSGAQGTGQSPVMMMCLGIVSAVFSISSSLKTVK